jgi:hypothetical protein
MQLIHIVLAVVMLGAVTPNGAPPATPGAGVGTVRIASQAARWTSLLPADELKDGGDTMFLISGEVENAGTMPVTSVKLSYELLADGTAGEAVVASEYGYNFRAEALRSPAVEAGEIPLAEVPIRPLAPGEKDLYRMVFFRTDVPRFDRWRVRIVEVR